MPSGFAFAQVTKAASRLRRKYNDDEACSDNRGLRVGRPGIRARRLGWV